MPAPGRRGRDDGHVTPGQTQRLADDLDERDVSGVVDRWRGDSYDETPFALPVDAVAGRPGSDPHRQPDTLPMGGKGESAHAGGTCGGRRPKMAVPTRTMVAPSSMATSKSWLMPMERCGPASSP